MQKKEGYIEFVDTETKDVQYNHQWPKDKEIPKNGGNVNEPQIVESLEDVSDGLEKFPVIFCGGYEVIRRVPKEQGSKGVRE